MRSFFLSRMFLLILTCFTTSWGNAKENITNTERNEQGNNKKLSDKITLKLTGIKNKALAENAQIYVNAINKDEANGSGRYQELVTQAIDKALRAEGYFGSKVSYYLSPSKHSETVLTAVVDVGKPVYIEEADVLIEGQAKTDVAFEELKKQEPKKGTLLNQGVYDDFKSNLEKLAQSRGYFDDEFLLHRLEIMPSTQQAWWRIKYNSGERYHYGAINFKDSQIREDYLRNILKIKSGEPYNVNDLSTLTSDFSETNWFMSVLLQPTLNEQKKLVDLDVLLYPRKKNTMRLGGGYSSEVGTRLQLGWTRPWINSRGHSLSTDLYISASEQNLSASYKMPLLEDPLRDYYEVTLGAENEKDNNIDNDSTAIATGFLRYWSNGNDWKSFLGLRSRYDVFTQASHSHKTLLFYPTAGVSWTKSKGGLFPIWGNALSVTVEYGKKFSVSSVDFSAFRVSSTLIRTYAENHRFYLRGEVGYLNTPDINRISPSMRYFAGGDKSVRGYGYKKISPKDSNGKYIGGSRLATGTLEYQYQVYPSWWVATFVDAGLAANTFNANELRYGTGVGVRWVSPIGSVKFDIATPVRDKDNSKNVQFYIGLGTEL